MSRKAAWFSATSAMYDTFKKTTDRYELSAKDKLIEFLKFHPAYMYDMFDVEIMVSRGELRYTNKNTGEKVVRRINKDDITSFPSVSSLIAVTQIKPQYEEVTKKLSIFKNKAWSYYYEDIDPATDTHIHIRHNREVSGLFTDEIGTKLRVHRALLNKIYKGNWLPVKQYRKIEKHKLRGGLDYIEFELFDGVPIKFPVKAYAFGGYDIIANEMLFYLLNSNTMLGLVRCSSELMQQFHESLLDIDPNYR